jgi:glycosyltransferase involved in cell wall biosynthesis
MSAAMPDTPIPLSILIRSYNEADRIAATITSAQLLGGEIVVVDAFSTDATVEIATKLGARVVQNKWPGFGPQRYFGEGICRYDHIFSLDADEIVTPAMARDIRALFLSGAPPALMIVRKKVIFPGHDRPPPLGFCHEQILIYDRRVARTGPNPNWDKLDYQSAEKPVLIKAPLWHHTFRDWNHAISKANYVAQLAAETQPVRHRTLLALRLFIEFPYCFIKFYIIRRYMLGGVDGLIMAVVSAFGRFIRIAKMYERAKLIDYGTKD